jgi:hypothetical protein
VQNAKKNKYTSVTEQILQYKYNLALVCPMNRFLLPANFLNPLPDVFCASSARFHCIVAHFRIFVVWLGE